MSFFNNFFGNSSSEFPEFWYNLESEEDFIAAIEKSTQKSVVIFKHSTRCIISKMVLKKLEKEIANSTKIKNADFYFLDLLKYREISNKIAEVLEVTHQSPQVILVQNKQAVYNESHDNIYLESLKKYFN